MIGRLLFVFGLAIVCEAAYTTYAYYTARADTIRAPIASGAIAILKAILVIAYVKEPIQIGALALGQMIGTHLTLKIIKGKFPGKEME
jgi:hypothetical protein